MENFSKLLNAVAAVLWPLVTFLLVMRYSGPLIRVLETARSRKFTVKVAGNELTMDEVREQQANLFAVLQERIESLEKRVPRSTLQSESQPDAPKARPIKRVLWVDDNPRNNSTLVDVLNRRGMHVVQVVDTNEALRSLEACSYDLIISDMGRPEGNRFVDDAGIQLTQRVRARYPDLPVFIFCSARKASSMKEEAMRAGTTMITSSGARLLEALEASTGRHVSRNEPSGSTGKPGAPRAT